MSSLPDRILLGRGQPMQRAATPADRPARADPAVCTASPASRGLAARPRSPDITALGAACLLVGLLALAAAWLAPALQTQTGMRWRILGLGVMFTSVGAGLLLRRDWARSASLGMLAYGIVALFTQGWLQEDVAAALFEALFGQPLAMSAAPQGVVLPGEAGGGWSLAVCVALGWYLIRLAGAGARAEFRPPQR